MVFGSTTLTSSWETLQWEIQMLSDVYANQPDLIIKHIFFLDMSG